MSAARFHFSPRPNRAADIQWRTWDATAFAAAREMDRPILLAISAVWCHWCHVMDETTYSDPQVTGLINEQFVPVRVDNDQRPDINARYNMGGWPTTVLLAPDGSILTGATYVPPQPMLRMLNEISSFYRENKDQIAQRVAETQARSSPPVPPVPEPLRTSMIARVAEEIADDYDESYGGFGTEQKFPQTDALEFLLLEHRISQGPALYEMVAKTMLGMSRGGMYDHVEGGFFRYSTTRDWSVPHFEKMAEDHAGLVRVLATLLLVSEHRDFAATLKSATAYITGVLYDAARGFFAGSQDADETYYALPLEERRIVAAPYIDRTAYANWNAALSGALLRAALVLEDDAVSTCATGVLDRLHERMLDRGGLLHPFLPLGGIPEVPGLLTDQAAYLRALLDAHERTGEPRFLERAKQLCEVLSERLEAPSGGYFDRAGSDGDLGNLGFKDRPLGDNAVVADSLLRLCALTGDDSYRTRAYQTLLVFAKSYGKARTFAAPFARALRRYLNPVSTVTVVGDPPATQEFRDVAARLPDPLLCVRTILPGDSAALRLLGFERSIAPAAYVCRGQTCSAPVGRASDLRAAFER
ncbi:MAG: DUF255 domain-containing protein [Vulcanimicrobiaceae bacterium]